MLIESTFIDLVHQLFDERRVQFSLQNPPKMGSYKYQITLQLLFESFYNDDNDNFFNPIPKCSDVIMINHAIVEL